MNRQIKRVRDNKITFKLRIDEREKEKVISEG